MEIIIRQITNNEIPEFYDVFKKLVMQEFTEYSVKLRSYLAENKRGINRDSLNYLIETDAIVLAVYAQEKIIGMLIADHPYLGVSFCTWIMVDSMYQKKGIGKQLLTRWERLSREKGAHALRLETFAHTRSFYEKAGFKLIGIDENGYCGKDKYLYKKQIQEVSEESMIRNTT